LAVSRQHTGIGRDLKYPNPVDADLEIQAISRWIN